MHTIASVPKTPGAAYYRERAAAYRLLAKGHTAAGGLEIAKKLNEFAVELEATAAKLDITAH